MNWDYEKLKKIDAYARHQLWINAREKAATGAENATALVQLIETSGLDYLRDKKPSMSIYDPIGIKMWKVISSPEAEAKAIEAHRAGRPPLAAVDPLLRHALGDDYSKNNEATKQAGYLVTRLMKMLGYQPTRRSAPLPQNCIARTGTLFRKSDDE